MLSKRIIFKVLVSCVVVFLSMATIAIIFGPLLVTYVPFDQIYDLTPQQTIILNEVLAGRASVYSSAVNFASIIIFLNLAITLAMIWGRINYESNDT